MSFRIVPPAGEAHVPALDEFQRQVVEHGTGPLLVLAGPGTGKTTTLVEAIVDRIERRGASPDQVLALTFSRKAAEQLRDRVTARLGRTMATQLSSTFHSFAYSLVREFGDADGLFPDPTRPPLRLLSAPEQEVVLAELLRDRRHAVDWPPELAQARRTRGFARELGGLLGRVTERGIGSRRLRQIGAAAGRADLVAAADFLDQYDDVLGGQNALDYSALIATAVALLQDPVSGVREQLRRRFRHVFVDEYQDTDPSQVALLRELVAPGAELVAVGDPHQSIYGFRGADVRGILQFPAAFTRTDGAPADVVVLRTTRRFGPALLEAAGNVAARLPLPGAIPGAQADAFRSPLSVPGAAPGVVEARTFDTDRAEAEHIADLLRRAHLTDGVPWSEMAVLVRSGRSTLPPLRRALIAAGVPVEVTADELPLHREGAVQPLLDALQAVADPAWLDPERARALLLSPLGGLDPTDLRAVSRALRQRVRDAGGHPAASPELLREALSDPVALQGLQAPGVERVRALTGLLAVARERLESGGSVEEVLWELWDGTGWPQRLRASAEGGSRLAHRDLDAVCALFEYAARVEERVGHTGVIDFLESLRAQEIPGDSLAERGVRGEAVRLMTAHRSKGLEWRVVVIAHVQEGTWPDVRLRSGLLGADELARDGLVPRASTRELLAEERRLFYVACTRARERLVVTAVASAAEDGEEPSRFLGELGLDVEPERIHTVGRPQRPLSWAGIVAELRRTAVDDDLPLAVREAAARRLRRLPVPAADPGSWWGTRALSRADAPVRPTGEPLRMSASLLTALERCPTAWFLEREAGGGQPSSQAQGFGNVLHALAERVGTGELVAEDRDALVGVLMDRLDEVWDRIPFRTPWSAAKERDEARAALERFVDWHRAAVRTPVAFEQPFSAGLTLADGTEVTLVGYADRLELDEAGRIVVVDLKTSKTPPSDKELHADPQLSLYQLAAERGAFADLVPEDGTGGPGGAELWQLRRGVRGKLKVQRQEPLEPAADGEERPIEARLRAAAEIIRAEEFPAHYDKSTCQRCAFRVQCPAWNSDPVI
ncbi:ATP-dependent helicase [Nocardioides sp. GY 10113]|uniref:ATP-dependent helicase n=1 Tax=Nocardioides sp. GY 10113 TaxID=2569761 RepID=UPI0010A8DC6D|nr:ATP-dependent DNA helicase [Nocardioides sp. GY 10113]TIC81271.1 ATP-dependent helicase [Nocardioides sp. GY 10113]